MRTLTLLILLLGVSHEAQAAPMCHGGRFKACTCWQAVSKAVSYRPTEPRCSGNAAILLRGKYGSVFSVVVRDSENRDRWPDPNCEANACSVFKVQKVIKTKDATINCLGAPGNSPLFANVQRITIKLKDVPGSTGDPLERLCLKSPRENLN